MPNTKTALARCSVPKRCPVRQPRTAPALSCCLLEGKRVPFLFFHLRNTLSWEPPARQPQRQAPWELILGCRNLCVLAIVSHLGTNKSAMTQEGERCKKQSPGEKKSVSEINRLNSKAKRKYPQSNLGNKSVRREQRMDWDSGVPSMQRSQAQPASEPGPTLPASPTARTGQTVPKDATADIFFINIFYFLFLD